jgi:plasmid stability protein
MTTFQIRDLPNDLHAELKFAAARNHRSISQEAIVQLRRAQGLDTSKRRALLKRLAEEGAPHWLKKGMPSPERLIREDRER